MPNPALCWRWAPLALLLAASAVFVSAGHPAALRAQQSPTPLAAGWNNLLYSGPPGPISSTLAALGGNLTGILLWDASNQRWHEYFPGSPQASDLQTMLTGQVYWIGVQSAAVLPAGVATPSPAQLVPGWNNVAYLGPGVAGSSSLEQSAVWAWDGATQKWLSRDPAHLSSSDFQALSTLRAYWINVSGATAPATAAPPGPAARVGCFPFTALQPALSETDDTLTRAGNAGLHNDSSLELPAEHTGTDGSGTQQPGYVSPTILRSISWIETSWHQATWDTQRGQSGPTLVSGGCAYGMMQIASGMSIDSTPSGVQQLIGSDFHANAEAGAQLLAKNWNRDGSVLPYFGRHDPHIIEDWYFAIWAYHCFGDSCAGYNAHDDPDDPSLPWPRPQYNSPQQLSGASSLTYSDYPYEELVFDLVGNPPIIDGHPLWQPIALQLPPHGAVGFPQPHAVGEASAHLDNGSSLAVYAPTPPAAASPGAVVPPGAPQVIGPQVTPAGGGH